MTAATISPGSAKIKFRLAGGAQPLILVPVHVNDRGPFDFILDTGAGTSLLASDLAKELELKTISSKEGQSAGGKVSVSLSKVDSLAAGKAKLGDVDVGIVDLSHIGKTIGARIDGDLGYNFLKHFRVTIDYRDCEIRFDDPKRVASFGRSGKTKVPTRPSLRNNSEFKVRRPARAQPAARLSIFRPARLNHFNSVVPRSTTCRSWSQISSLC